MSLGDPVENDSGEWGRMDDRIEASQAGNENMLSSLNMTEAKIWRRILTEGRKRKTD